MKRADGGGADGERRGFLALRREASLKLIPRETIAQRSERFLALRREASLKRAAARSPAGPRIVSSRFGARPH